MATNPPQSNQVHPLASLYKKSDTQEPKSHFKFFPTEDEHDDSPNSQAQASPHYKPQSPLTPFTKRDFESRDIRSSAPTPDTIHNKKGYILPYEFEESICFENEDENVEYNDKGNRPSGCEQVERSSIWTNDDMGKENTSNECNSENQSDFQKWFWANQGQINRGWKKRRKLVMKEQKQKNKSKKNFKIY
ncbi:hypothetical protein HI914_02026 [Erysiphe necator]|nr:hypothetical protein HI914_02026 [Erysiphe necator]